MASPIMQFLQQLLPPASFPLPQATPYQWVRRSAPHRRVDKAGQFFGVYDAPEYYHHTLEVSQDAHRSERPGEMPSHCPSRYDSLHQGAVHAEPLIGTHWSQTCPDGKEASYHPIPSRVQWLQDSGCKSRPIARHCLYSGLTQLYPVPCTQYQYSKEHRLFQPPLGFQQLVPIIHKVPPCQIYPGGFSWAGEVRAFPRQMPNARQVVASPSLNTAGANHGLQTLMGRRGPLAPSEVREGPGSYQLWETVLPYEFAQDTAGCSIENIRPVGVPSVCPTSWDKKVRGPSIPETVTLADTISFFSWQGTQAQMTPSSVTTCDTVVPASARCWDHPTLRWDPSKLGQRSHSLVTAVDVPSGQDALLGLSACRVTSTRPDKCSPHDQWWRLHYGPESLPEDLTSCKYEDPTVYTLVSSMDYFYSVSTDGALSSTEEIPSAEPHTPAQPSTLEKPSTKLILQTKRRLPLQGTQSEKRRKCDPHSWPTGPLPLAKLQSMQFRLKDLQLIKYPVLSPTSHCPSTGHIVHTGAHKPQE
ncbi:uncharacterized protein LOC142502655 [Ascaphus truei]|uniref:uncharacterized protein LOC142502655 n=1 Tax=Ascaphus truei TaxID=8439 RepID=UPI003F5993B5